jgi:hypothetical protein
MSGNPNLAIAEAIFWMAMLFIPLMLGAPL